MIQVLIGHVTIGGCMIQVLICHVTIGRGRNSGIDWARDLTMSGGLYPGIDW